MTLSDRKNDIFRNKKLDIIILHMKKWGRRQMIFFVIKMKKNMLLPTFPEWLSYYNIRCELIEMLPIRIISFLQNNL